MNGMSGLLSDSWVFHKERLPVVQWTKTSDGGCQSIMSYLGSRPFLLFSSKMVHWRRNEGERRCYIFTYNLPARENPSACLRGLVRGENVTDKQDEKLAALQNTFPLMWSLHSCLTEVFPVPLPRDENFQGQHSFRLDFWCSGRWSFSVATSVKVDSNRIPSF